MLQTFVLFASKMQDFFLSIYQGYDAKNHAAIVIWFHHSCQFGHQAATDSILHEQMKHIRASGEGSPEFLIPRRVSCNATYVHPVQSLVERDAMRDGSTGNLNYGEKGGRKTGGFILGHSSLLTLAKFIDGYLAEIGCGLNLPLSTFRVHEILQSNRLQEALRQDACMHATLNNHLPPHEVFRFSSEGELLLHCFN